MQYVNEYEMTKKRYVKWATPVFYRLPIFYVLCAVCIFSIFAWIYFDQHNVPQRWVTLACFMVAISIYRGILYRPLSADKQYRLQRQTSYDDKSWTIKMVIERNGITIYTNNKKTGYSHWSRIIEFREAKTFFDLIVDNHEQIRLDKSCFTTGDSDSFKTYMLECHAEIPYSVVSPRFNK